MERKTMVVKGVTLEVSTHPFVIGFHYTAVTKPITIIDAEAAASRSIKQLTTPVAIKRAAKALEEEIAAKKAKIQDIPEPEPTETAEQIRERLVSRFQIPSILQTPASKSTPPPEVVDKPATPTVPVIEASHEKLMQLLDCLNNLQAFSRAQAELLARHGIVKYIDDLSKLSVWDKGYPRPRSGVLPPLPPPAPVTSAAPSPNMMLRRKPRPHWGVNFEELLKGLGVVRPPCYTGMFKVARVKRSESARDVTLREYHADRNSLFQTGTEVEETQPAVVV